jgi:hypothetical protein
MACVDYMTNFYNDANFRTDTYAHFLGDVIQMCNMMIKQTYTLNTEILNEILELYRFIVEKYASHASQTPHIVALVQFMQELWGFFVEKAKTISKEANEEENLEENEINIAFQSIMRIMSHIIAVSIIFNSHFKDLTYWRDESRDHFRNSENCKQPSILQFLLGQLATFRVRNVPVPVDIETG